jgi:hypothetical protein
VIDDNSNQEFVKPEFDYQNVEFIQSEYPGRGELLPYYYFYKRKFFKNAVIIHDSVFFHKRVDFDKVTIKALPLWHFNADKENVENTIRLASVLKNNYTIIKNMQDNDIQVLGINKDKWNGCFGVQSYINHDFLSQIAAKYSLFNLLNVVKNRADRCCLERILGFIFSTNQRGRKTKSLLGNIMTYSTWGRTFEEYCEHLEKNKFSTLPIVKVWTGR